MYATGMAALRFDGRDITDYLVELDDVRGYALRPCRCCGTVVDTRFPFCCAFSSEALSQVHSLLAPP